MSINMPECPPDLSEAQYASLVLETDCSVSEPKCRIPRLKCSSSSGAVVACVFVSQVCGAPNIQRVDFTLRVRLCRGCFREK